MKKRQLAITLAFYLILLVVTVLFAELSLRFAAAVWDKADVLTRPDCPDSFVVDAQGSISKGNPACFEHDARGYRNRHALAKADIVALGDSFTYGTSTLDNAWPQILAKSLKATVYNMGIPSTGPLLNLQHLPEALALKPRRIIFGFYFGNDLFDDFEYAQKHGMLSAYADQNTLKQIAAAESQQSLEAKVGVLFQNGLQGRPSGFGMLKSYLSNHSRLYQALRALKNRMSADIVQSRITGILEPGYEQAVAGILDSERPYVAPFSENGWKTIFTAPYRLMPVDLRDVRIRTGLEIAKRTLVEMNRICAEHQVAFTVVLLPTKEFAFQKRVSDPLKFRDYKEAVDYEQMVKTELMNSFRESNIDFVDPTDLLQGASKQPYRENADGHPNDLGHQLIASAIETHLAAHSSNPAASK